MVMLQVKMPISEELGLFLVGVPHRLKGTLKLGLLLVFVLLCLPVVFLLLWPWTKAKPIWNIAHMSNTIPEAESALRLGANGLEVDVRFDEEGKPTVTGHGLSIFCDCGRECNTFEDFLTYLRFIRQVSDPDHPTFQENLVVVVFDLKTKAINSNNLAKAGRNLADILTNHLWDNGTVTLNIRVVFCLYNVNVLTLAAAFHERLEPNLLKNVGWFITSYQKPSTVKSAFQSINFTCRTWQSDGSFNCFPYSHERLISILNARNSETDGNVLFWTVDAINKIQRVLELGVDAVLTNRPDRVLTLLKAPHYRLATRNDDPFAKSGPCTMLSTKQVASIIPPKDYKNNIPSVFEALFYSKLVSMGFLQSYLN